VSQEDFDHKNMAAVSVMIVRYESSRSIFRLRNPIGGVSPVTMALSADFRQPSPACLRFSKCYTWTYYPRNIQGLDGSDRYSFPIEMLRFR